MYIIGIAYSSVKIMDNGWSSRSIDSSQAEFMTNGAMFGQPLECE